MFFSSRGFPAVLASTWFLASSSFAAPPGGQLPRGNMDDAAEEARPLNPSASPQRNCYGDLANPPGGNGFFTPDGRFFYLLADTTPEASPAKAAGQKSQEDPTKLKKSQYTLYKVNLASAKAEIVLSLDHLRGASLLTYGQPLERIAAIVFSGRMASCYEGPASLVNIAFNKDGGKAAKIKGHHWLVRTPFGLQLVDTKRNVMFDVDATTLQMRGSTSLPAGDRPLFFDANEKQFFAWRSGKQRGLTFYQGERPSMPERYLVMNGGDRLLQDRDRFGVAHFDALDNSIELHELKDWSQVASPGKFKIKIPKLNLITTAGIDINFDKRLALVFGAAVATRQQWQKVLIFNYNSPNPLEVMTAPARQYIHWSAIDPTGALAAFELRALGSQKTVGLKLFDFNRKSYKEVKLPESAS